MNKKLVVLSALLVVLLPITVLAFAEPPQPSPNQNISVAVLVDRILNLLVWPLATGIVIILFIMAGFIFLTAQGEPAKIQEARRAVIWGIVGVIIIVISFSIVRTIGILLNLAS